MSTQRDWITSHVERCLDHVFDNAETIRDDAGEYPYRWDSAACWVQVLDTEPAFVRVYAHAAHHVRRSAKLFSELNDVNTRAITAHTYWVDGLVVVEQVLHPAGLEPVTLEQACASVGRVAADIGPLIASVHGGATPFTAEEQTADGGR